MSPLSYLDRFLNAHTMYRVVAYGLGVLVLTALVLAQLALLPFTVGQLAALLGVTVGVSYVAHLLLQKLFHSTYNVESSLITGLIFFFVLSPMLNITDLLVTVLVVMFGALSKYLLAVEKKHLFNPVAIAAVVMGVFGFGNAIWWVGSALLLPAVVLVGLAIVHKVRRMDLFASFMAASLLVGAYGNRSSGDGVLLTVVTMLSSWPLLFLGTVMLTEPLTGPNRRDKYLIYGAVVGVLTASRFQLGPFHSTPELALVMGNILAYLMTQPVRLQLRFKRKRQIATDIYEFDFESTSSFSFRPGQYMEWTIPATGADSRGNRRYFTLASAPTEGVLRIAIKITPDASSFKQQLLAMQPGSSVVASQLAGDFVLPRDVQQKLVLVAGGIGITPFRSMARYLLDQGERRDVVLFYICSHPDEFAYGSLWKQMVNLGWKVVFVVTNRTAVSTSWTGEVGYLTANMLKRQVPDYGSRLFYLSGPNTMVAKYRQLLRQMGVSNTQIKTDYFPGF